MICPFCGSNSVDMLETKLTGHTKKETNHVCRNCCLTFILVKILHQTEDGQYQTKIYRHMKLMNEGEK